MISVIGVGDIIMGTNYPNTSYLPANDGGHLPEPVKDILKNADVTFGNPEGVLPDEGAPGRTVRSLQRLKINDFPETPLRILSDGRIKRADRYPVIKKNR